MHCSEDGWTAVEGLKCRVEYHRSYSMAPGWKKLRDLVRIVHRGSGYQRGVRSPLVHTLSRLPLFASLSRMASEGRTKLDD